MGWTFKKAPVEMENLKPETKEKALEIARKLIEEKGWPEKKAINEAIRRAEEWAIDRAG